MELARSTNTCMVDNVLSWCHQMPVLPCLLCLRSQDKTTETGETSLTGCRGREGDSLGIFLCLWFLHSTFRFGFMDVRLSRHKTQFLFRNSAPVCFSCLVQTFPLWVHKRRKTKARKPLQKTYTCIHILVHTRTHRQTYTYTPTHSCTQTRHTLCYSIVSCVHDALVFWWKKVKSEIDLTATLNFYSRVEIIPSLVSNHI